MPINARCSPETDGANEPQCVKWARQSRSPTGCANIYRPRVHHLCTCHSIFGSFRFPHPQHFPHPCGERRRGSAHEHNWQKGRWPASVPSLQASIAPHRGPHTGCVKGGLLTLARRVPPARPCPDLDRHSTHIRVKRRTRAKGGPPSAVRGQARRSSGVGCRTRPRCRGWGAVSPSLLRAYGRRRWGQRDRPRPATRDCDHRGRKEIQGIITAVAIVLQVLDGWLFIRHLFTPALP